MAYNKDSPKNIIPALTGIDKKLAANFSVIVLILMLIVALACFMVYSKIAENNEKELQKTIVNLLADSINRISFSGKYHARLLVDQIVSSQKKIAGIMILTPSFEVLAQSRDDRGIPYDFVFEKSLVKEVYEKKKPIITDPETRNDSIRQVAFPYRSGYRNKVTGVILVDLITDCSLRVNSYIHAYLFLLILVLTIVSLVIIYIISKKISGPVIDMAWQFEKILSHSPFLIRISDNSKKVLAKSLSLEKIDEMIFSETPQQKEEFLEIATDQVFEKNEFIEKELSLTVQGRKLTFWVTGFPVLKTEKGLTQMACSIALDITDRKQAEQELKNQEKNLQITLDSIGEAVIATDSDNRITRMNPVAQRLTGWSLKEAMGLDLDKVFCIYDFAERRVIKNSIKKLLEPLERKEVSGRNILVSRSGTEYQIENSGALIRTELDEIKGAVFVFRDVTEKYTLIENLSHKSKMDAIGQLAGGVAHDFNNLLSGIMSAAELIGIQLEESEEDVTQLINVIMQSSSRAADLISKLLAFGRKGKIISRDIDIHNIIDETAAILSRTIDKKININIRKNAQNSNVYGDETGLQNALLNLGINASNAMPAGGEFTFETQNTYLNEDFCSSSSFDIDPGSYIKISVRDTGSGICTENLSKIFKPFFTTKYNGGGTGLGLSAVYGMVQDHHGAIDVYSRVGAGTVFSIYLKCSEKPVDPVPVKKDKKIIKGSGLILFADDESSVRITGKKLLESMGYNVILAKDGLECVDLYTECKDKIDLVILDMIMPGLKGSEVFDRLKKINPKSKIIIASGFPKDQDIDYLRTKGLDAFISKPFRLRELSSHLETVLSGQQSDES